MRRSSTEELRDVRGQHLAAGNVLIGLGGMGALVGLFALARGVSLLFIDAPTMLAFGVAMAGLGWSQKRSYP